MTTTRNDKKRVVAGIILALFGIVFAIIVFCLTDNWRRRVHAITVGAINIGVAIYLNQSPDRKNKKGNPNQAAQATARKLADPGR